MLLLAFLLLFAADPAQTLQQELKKFVDVFATVESQAADPVDMDRAFYEGAIPGMLRKLDPHSVFFDPDQFAQLQQMEKSEQKGFGSVVSVLPGRVIVLQTMPGSPSEKAGLTPGDEILGINGYLLAKLSFDQLVELLTEARQKEANLVVRHAGDTKLFPLTLKPQIMNAPTVDRTFLVQPGIGYIRVTSFDPATGKAVRDAIEKLGGNKLKALVLDLRDNPGGVAQAALDTASLFLKPGQLVFSIRGRAKQSQELDVPQTADPYTFRLAVLINDKTASASEIVTGALQDHDRAVVLGEPSYGKGLVQSVYPLANETGLALTVAYYYTPSGRSIQKPLTSGELQSATDSNAGKYKTDSGRIVTGGGGIQPDDIIYTKPPTPLENVIEESGAFAIFAGEYLRDHKVGEDFAVPPSMLDQFQLYLAEHRINPSLAEWTSERTWIQSRLQQEALNMAVGIEKGDEVEVQRDPVVQNAVTLLSASSGH